MRPTLLKLARWLIVAYAVAQLVLTVAGIALFPRYAETHLNSTDLVPNTSWKPAQVQAALRELGWPATTIAWVALTRSLVGIAVVYPVLVLLLARGGDNWFSLYVALAFAVNARLDATAFLPLYHRVPGLAAAAEIIGATGWQMFFVLFYFFPDGRAVPRWTRWLAWAWGILLAIQIVAYPQVARYFGRTGVNPAYIVAIILIYVALVVIAIGSQVYRYLRRSDPVQRQQTKLVVYVLALAAIAIGAIFPLGFRSPSPERLGFDLIVASVLWYLFGLQLPLVAAAIGLAILRYRLWDIDVVIRRTLVYSILTGMLAFTYFGAVLVLQNVFRVFTGQAQNSLAAVLSTLAIAALFVPLRSRLQRAIDRRFFRSKYDAARALSAFAANARDETDLEHLSAHLVRVVDDTMQPENVSLWLRPPAA